MKGIYILINPAFQNYVKLGYSDNVEKRCKELSNTSVPFPFKLYAVYETDTSLSDVFLHNIIDRINPDVRVTPNREFYEMTPEVAYYILLDIARISGTEDKVKLMRFSEEDVKNCNLAEEVDNRHLYSLERADKNIKEIYKELCDYCESLGTDVISGNTSQYYVCKRNGSNFTAIAVRHNKLLIGLYQGLEELGLYEEDGFARDITALGNFGTRAFTEVAVVNSGDAEKAKPLIKKCYDNVW